MYIRRKHDKQGSKVWVMQNYSFGVYITLRPQKKIYRERVHKIIKKLKNKKQKNKCVSTHTYT